MQIESWGYHTIPVSAASGQGLAQLNEALQGKVSVVAGPSGALSALYTGQSVLIERSLLSSTLASSVTIGFLEHILLLQEWKVLAH